MAFPTLRDAFFVVILSGCMAANPLYDPPDGSPDGDADSDTELSDGDSYQDSEPDSEIDRDTQGCDSDGQCDDLVECTLDQCVEGECRHTLLHDRCEDPFICTVDRCELTGCIHETRDDVCPVPGDTCDEYEGCVNLIWVDKNCDPCGAGTESAPFKTIAEGIEHRLPIETTKLNLVQILEGEYVEPEIVVDDPSRPLMIRGKLGDDLNPLVEWNSREGVLIVRGNGTKVGLRKISLHGDKIGLVCREKAGCHLEQVWIRGSENLGLLASQWAYVTFERGVIRDNGKAGIGIDSASKVTIANSFIVENGGSVAEAGAIHIVHDDVELKLINSTIADNNGGTNPGRIRSPAGTSMTLVNNIFWNNTGESSHEDCPGCIHITSLEGDRDPYFSALVGMPDRYKLTELSISAIDAGSLSSEVRTIDFWGAPRPESALDIGAHEFSDGR